MSAQGLYSKCKAFCIQPKGVGLPIQQLNATSVGTLVPGARLPFKSSDWTVPDVLSYLVMPIIPLFSIFTMLPVLTIYHTLLVYNEKSHQLNAFTE
jgi:hypothetical protein